MVKLRVRVEEMVQLVVELLHNEVAIERVLLIVGHSSQLFVKHILERLQAVHDLAADGRVVYFDELIVLRIRLLVPPQGLVHYVTRQAE